MAEVAEHRVVAVGGQRRIRRREPLGVERTLGRVEVQQPVVTRAALRKGPIGAEQDLAQRVVGIVLCELRRRRAVAEHVAGVVRMREVALDHEAGVELSPGRVVAVGIRGHRRLGAQQRVIARATVQSVVA